ncbi:alanine racemase [Ruminococcus sp.]|uniref:alanine racemase n=1 Tax=Ruminococcus sp. TaxID=41978 RepID=UPI0025CEE412|nr:alanine racemase [Ruminococcus sp.]MBQ8967684.1 alanine racemase [Ruminococcus sp.]
MDNFNNGFIRRCWAEIDLSAVEYNVNKYKELLAADTELMCVVKASCYGHGDELIVPFLQEKMGVCHFAVANLDEAVRLRDMGIGGDILILGYTHPDYAPLLSEYNVIQACTDLSYARSLSEKAEDSVRLHGAVDTGMTRIGVHGTAEEQAAELSEIAVLPNIKLEGIFTHFSSADGTTSADDEYTKMQAERFFRVRDLLEAGGIKLKQAHIQNSAGGAYGYGEGSTLARLGIIMYGLYPDPAKPLPFEPKPVMTWKALVSQVKWIDEGTAVSYGRTFVSDRRMKLATITAGYADGYPRSLSNKGEVIIGGKRCRICGRVCMDQFMCDVTDLDDIKPGDEAILMNAELNADRIAELTGTIGYEVTCDITARVPRVLAE